MKLEHIFFDLDHTLWDFDRNSAEAIGELYVTLGLQDQGVESLDVFLASYRKINSECWRAYRNGEIDKGTLREVRFKRALGEFGIDDPDLSLAFSEGYIATSPQKTNLIPGTLNLLAHIRRKGIPMHIITNGFSEVQFIKLENSGLSEFFDVVLTSEMVGEKKPHPSVFARAIAMAETQADVSLMIGDSLEVDVQGALSHGLQAIHYNRAGMGKRDRGEYWEVSHLDQITHII